MLPGINRHVPNIPTDNRGSCGSSVKDMMMSFIDKLLKIIPPLYTKKCQTDYTHKKNHLFKYSSYFIKSEYSIQKTPSLLPWAISSWRRCCGQSVHSSDQLPFHEKRPHGFRSRNSLMYWHGVTSGGRWLTWRESQIQDPVSVSILQAMYCPRLILYMTALLLITCFILLLPLCCVKSILQSFHFSN